MAWNWLFKKRGIMTVSFWTSNKVKDGIIRHLIITSFIFLGPIVMWDFSKIWINCILYISLNLFLTAVIILMAKKYRKESK